ncbi:hypothetical protein [Parabacteroides gordonii]|jgi:hypothetical protein|uniref:DUF3106 domain-containing protein n=1 Tax=Parabacteroides gordonii MS-1 = DSM 23371 TaxID=1203610 RepID=A0A0F5IVM9_9BACT|nr:hypothetical protein [Parabacteroides gordonii]KKB49310.1 hypothetical protein HMPREF1536_04374 [Parabacteroides gordonii MS-1 = DSM 23371]MCA5585579.1 hypothetical protein [Parabacteroides gordonii]RGP16872.1 hypothetical protein DXB27_09145 [Parabacteroides gordonii]
MKRIYLLCMLMLLCSLPGQAQFWISFGWNEPHCQSCLWMEQAMRLNGRQAADYHNIVHKYGQKIEKEARKHYRYWDQSAKKIFNLRMERDRKLQRVLSPSQFRLYVRFVRERPQRIHDYQGWYNNPNYPDYRPSHVCWRYEDHYWYNEWVYSNGRWNGRFDDGKWYPGKYDSPGHRNHRPDRYDRPSRPDHNQHYDRPSRPHNDRYSKDKKSDNRRDRDKARDDKDRKEKDKKDKKENKRQESKRSEVYRRS